FGNLTLDKVGTGYTLTAADGSLLSATSTAFNITVAAADHLVFGIQPTSTVAGHQINPAPTVRIVDAFGNLETTDTSTVVMGIGNNPGGGTLAGSLSVQASGGVATFSNLSIDKVGNGYTLSASDGALTGVISGGFNITPSFADHLVITT